MTKTGFESALETKYNKFTCNVNGKTTTYEFGFPKQTVSITDMGVAGISISFYNRSSKQQQQIDRIFHWEDVYQLLSLTLEKPELFLKWNDTAFIAHPERYHLKNRVPNNMPWTPVTSLVDLEDDELNYALELVKLGVVSKVELSSDGIQIEADSGICNAGNSTQSDARNNMRYHLQNIVFGSNVRAKMQPSKTLSTSSLETGLVVKCDSAKCAESCCILMACAYIEYVLRYGDLSKALGERIRTRREYRTPSGPFSFTWKPGGTQDGVLRMVSENMFQLANQMLRDGQIEVAKDLTGDNCVEIISYVRLPEQPISTSASELTFTQMAVYVESRKDPASRDEPISYKIEARANLFEKNIPLQIQVYFCAGYISYLRDCGMQDLIDRDRRWYRENEDLAAQSWDMKFNFTLPTDLFLNEPNDVFELAELLQERNFISLNKNTVIFDGKVSFFIDNVKAVNCPADQVDALRKDIIENRLPHKDCYSATPDVDNKLRYDNVLRRQLMLAAYVDYLRRTAQYGDYTKHRLRHQKETTSQFESTTSENPELEKVFALAKSEADSSLYCIIEAERGAGQDEIVEQIAMLLSQQGKLERPEPVHATFLDLAGLSSEELPKRTLVVISGLREFLYASRKSVLGDGKRETRMMEQLGRYAPQTFVIVLAEQENVTAFLELSPQIRFLFGDNIIPIQNLSAEKMYEAFAENLPDELKGQLAKNSGFKDTFMDYLAINRNLLPLDNQELADYLAAYASTQNSLCLPPDVNRTQSVSEMLDSIIGMDNVKKKAYEFEKYAIYRKRAEMNGMELPNSHMHMVFTGNPGTGKTMIARIMAEMLFSIGIVKTNRCKEVERKDLIAEYVGQTATKTSEVIKEAMDGVLFIDEAYALAPQSSNDYGGEAIATLIKAMEDHQDRLVMIFAGYEKEMHDFLTANPGLVSRIGYTFHFDDYSASELVRMFDTKMRKAGFEYSEDEFLPLIQDRCEHFSEQKDFGNGRFVDRLMQNVILTHSQRELTNEMINCLIPEDVPSIEALASTDSEEHRDYEEQLDAFIGMENVKAKIRQFAKFVEFQQKAKKEGGKVPGGNLHMIFTGNPGTGKTTIARIMADMLFSIGVIRTHKFIEAERKDLIAEYVGQTAKKTGDVIDRAMGGILFIDEAYTLTPHRAGDFGAEAIATLIKAMEDNKNNLIVIFAGYKEEMRQFKNANPGIASRIGYTFDFDDYSTEELLEIFMKKADSAQFYVEEEAKDKIRILFDYFTKQKNFGNGRFVDRLLQETIIKHSETLSDDADLLTIRAEDIPEITDLTDMKKETADTLPLDAVIGMASVKERVKEFEHYVNFGMRMRDRGVSIPDFNMHMLFTGNPGTGKTMVARIIAQRLYDIGVIQTNNFVEVERKDLISEYVGQTASKTADVIEKAMGGVLFIDEAYTLTPQSSSDYGAEAIATLIKAMEDHKDNLIVIFAGYKEEMRQFKNANPGIASRIGYTFDFDDYSTEELLEIFLKKAESTGLLVEEEAKDKICILFDYFTKQKNFGNGRFVDRLLQETIMKHSMSGSEDENEDDLLTIRAEDIPEITDLTDMKKESASTLSLDSVIGMASVKARMEEFEHFVNFGMVARDRGLSIPDFNLHMLFTGNPGTGKTMVARIIAQRLYDIGVIKSNNFVEVERKDLVAEYIGQTAVKTAEVIDRAMGGVLFIDEAYTLTPQHGTDFGAEAIATLIKAMEDHKDNLIVIFAGYKEEMRGFVHSNPGIASRLGFTFEFEGYSPEELREIFLNKISANGFSVNEEAMEKVLRLMGQFSEKEDFGNGRFVDSVIQKTLLHHAENYKDETVELIVAEDIPNEEEMNQSMGTA